MFKARRALIVTLIAGSTIASTGCSSGGGFSIASMNPFSKPKPAQTRGGGEAPGVTESLASMTDSAKSGVTTFGASARKAVGKTTDAVTGVFSKPSSAISESDPLSLSNKPETVNAEVYVANGQLWESSGDLTKAMESYTKALESEPNNADAMAKIARLHFRQGKYQQANENFQRALTHTPNDAELHNDVALTQSKLNDTAGAVASFEMALKLSPGTSRYANNLATVHFESGDAAAAYRVLVTNNKPAVAHFNMAYLHFKNGQQDEAKKHLNGAVQYQSQASSDAIVKRAVDRSREMLAQIEASAAPVAQAAPQATIAGGQFFNGRQSSPVQQTARSIPSTAAKAAPAPATQAITPPAAPTYIPASPATTAPTVTAPTVTASTAEVSTWNQKQTATSAAKPVRPTAPVATPSSPSVESKPASSKDGSGPSFPFSMPAGFNPEG